jgi:hypothetical protein
MCMNEYFQPSSFALDKSGKKIYWLLEFFTESYPPDIDFENPMLTTTQKLYTFTRYGFLILHWNSGF